MGQLNASNDFLESRIYTGLLIQQNFRADKAVLQLQVPALLYLSLFSGGCIPDIPQPVGEIWSFSAETGMQGVFNFSQLKEKNPNKTTTTQVLIFLLLQHRFVFLHTQIAW